MVADLASGQSINTHPFCYRIDSSFACTNTLATSFFVTQKPGESIPAEAGALTSMDGQLTMTTQFSGGFFPALLRQLFGGESLFVNVFKNKTDSPLTLVLSQSIVGDIERIDLTQGSICFQL